MDIDVRAKIGVARTSFIILNNRQAVTCNTRGKRKGSEKHISKKVYAEMTKSPLCGIFNVIENCLVIL